jgi:hypothetical protein
MLGHKEVASNKPEGCTEKWWDRPRKLPECPLRNNNHEPGKTATTDQKTAPDDPKQNHRIIRDITRTMARYPFKLSLEFKLTRHFTYKVIAQLPQSFCSW